MLRVSVLLLLLSLCAGAHAQEACPWLTLGTAQALLGGAASGNVHVSAGEGNCDFKRDAGPGQAGASSGSDLELKIAVGRQQPQECATGEQLNGIGEDSVWCAMDAGGERVDIIRGRVRATYFLLTLTAHGIKANDKVSMRRSLERAAEEVAGSLF